MWHPALFWLLGFLYQCLTSQDQSKCEDTPSRNATVYMGMIDGKPLSNACAPITDSGDVPEVIHHLPNIEGWKLFEGSQIGTEQDGVKGPDLREIHKSKNMLKGGRNDRHISLCSLICHLSSESLLQIETYLIHLYNTMPRPTRYTRYTMV